MTSAFCGLSLVIISFIQATWSLDLMNVDASALTGTYEFEILGRPMRFYICNSKDEDSAAFYWAGSDLVDMEYTFIVGRDMDGLVPINIYVWEAECEIFRLYGHDVLTGYWKIRYNKRLNSYTLYERFPDIEEQDEEVWNTYSLHKISHEIVADPEMKGVQCFAPSPDYPIGNPTSPECWMSNVLQPTQVIAHQFFGGDETGCWVFITEQGLVSKGGYNYDFREEWDGALLILRWDDQINVDDYDIGRYHCLRGSMFVVRAEQNKTIFSYQCEDRITGDQYLTYQENSDRCNDLTCPLWTEDKTRHKFMTSAAPTAMPTRNPTYMVPTANPTWMPTTDPSSDPMGSVTGMPTTDPASDPIESVTGSPTYMMGHMSDHTRDTDAFELIISILQTCVGDALVEHYLAIFEEERVNDSLLNLLSDSDWEEIFPELGFRVCFTNQLINLT